jgi:hypothetical protein
MLLWANRKEEQTQPIKERERSSLRQWTLTAFIFGLFTFAFTYETIKRCRGECIS